MKIDRNDIIKYALVLGFNYITLILGYFFYTGFGTLMYFTAIPCIWFAAAYINFKIAPNIFVNLFLNINLMISAYFTRYLSDMRYFNEFPHCINDPETKMFCGALRELSLIYTGILTFITFIYYIKQREKNIEK